MKLIRNVVKCKRCGEILESKADHDYKVCSCKFLAIDGGLASPRIIGNETDYEILYEWSTRDENEIA